MSRVGLLALLTACSGGADDSGVTSTPVQPIALESGPAEAGVPVGQRTISLDGYTLEVWYPAVDTGDSIPMVEVDFLQFIPDVFAAAVPEFQLPSVGAAVIPDAEPRDAGEPLPLVLFSHGFGGMRIQSFSLAQHLASRGYIVVAADHPGRMLTDVLPCIFSPPLEGCDLSGFAADPGPDGLDAALRWADAATTDGDFAGRIDTDQLGVFGHSAGAGSVTTYAGSEPRVKAVAPMAGGGVPSREVPLLRIDGSCDGFVPAASPTSIDGHADAAFVTIAGAGHLAFSDLCSLDIAGFAEDYLDPRGDLNAALYPQLKGLGTDGCEGAEPQAGLAECSGGFLSLQVSDEIVRYHLTVFFDAFLKGRSGGPETSFEDAEVYRP